MVSALWILALGLGGAFGLGLMPRGRNDLGFAMVLATLGAMALIALGWLTVMAQGAAPVIFTTAAAPAPFAISLRIGLPEAAALSAILIAGALSVLSLRGALMRLGRGAMAVLLVLIMALCGIVLTRDLFNLFVFFELVAIATAGLVLLSPDPRALAAGFKYLVISQIVSILLLVGIVFTYHAQGALGLDAMAATAPGVAGAGLAMFLVLIALIIEVKPFPANGWALDIYETAHPGFAALFSAGTGTAAVFALAKVVAVAGPGWLGLMTGVGALSFLGASVLALRQGNDRRLLGYSSVAQLGLVMIVLGQGDILGDRLPFVAGGVLLAHAAAKAGLFWLSALVPGRALADWASLRSRPVLIGAFLSFLAMLLGLPPFPGFYAKWQLAQALAAEGRMAVLALVLAGSLIEAAVLFRWFGRAIKADIPAPIAPARLDCALVFAALAAGWGLGALWGGLSGLSNVLMTVPVLFALAFVALEPLPARVKNVIAILGLLAWFALRLPDYDPLRLIFAIVMLPGGAVILLASFTEGGRRLGFYPPTMLMYAGMALLLDAATTFQFFAAWEILTLGSYLLILRGRLGEPHAQSYILFSLGGAFALLAGFALAGQGAGDLPLAGLAQVPAALAPVVFVLLAAGFLTKTAAMGLHTWLPGAHAEAETDVSPMVSGVLLKAGLYGIVVLLMQMGRQHLGPVDLVDALAWLGALSALIGAVLAVFQEDAKRLLAYSSISQMGYALFGLALMNHLGWLLALMFVINHYLYKSMLFLAIGGVYRRTHTKLMYQMGGLITLMPFSFVSVLVGIVAMSGVPPLSGFGGRWIFYNAILDTDLRLPLVMIFLAGPVGFLYLFRLIHTIFLGQLKDPHRQLREAPFWMLVPQMIYVGLLIGFAVLPGMILRRVDGYLGTVFGDQPLIWTGRAVTSEFGHWNPVGIMLVIIGIFVSVGAVLIAKAHGAQKVKQFNIVFSAERPYRPETTHFAWNFFAPYRRAVGFVETPLATRFWGGVGDAITAGAELTRRLYTGNGQLYAAQVVLFVVVLWAIIFGGLS